MDIQQIVDSIGIIYQLDRNYNLVSTFLSLKQTEVYGYSKKEIAASNKLTGLTILATGTLNNFSRDGIKQSVIENGGTYASGISKKLDYLIVGAAAGSSKLKKAEEFGIKQISDDDYINLIS